MIAMQSHTKHLSVKTLKEYSFITFSEREPYLRGLLCWDFCSQRCIGVSKTCMEEEAEVSEGSEGFQQMR